MGGAAAAGAESPALRYAHLAVLALAALVGLAAALGLIGGTGVGPRARGPRGARRARGPGPCGGAEGVAGSGVEALLKACPAVGRVPRGGGASLLDRLAGAHPRTLAALRPAPAPRGWEPERVEPGVTLLWRRPAAPGRPLSGAAPAPVLLLLPGSPAEAAAGHWATLGEAFFRAGWVCCAVSEAAPGAVPSARSPPTCTRGLTLAVRVSRERFPEALLAGAGFGFGANVLVRYLADKGARCRLAAAFAVSPLWDLFSTLEALRGGALLRGLYGGLLPAGPAGRPPFGFDSWYDFHRNASAALHLRRVRRPLLCLGAADDPLVSPCVTQAVLEDSEESGDVAVWMTATGGHLGLLEGGLFRALLGQAAPRWLGAALEFFAAACEAPNPAAQLDSPDFGWALASASQKGPPARGAGTPSPSLGGPATPAPSPLNGEEKGARGPERGAGAGPGAGGAEGREAPRPWLTPEAKHAALLSAYAAAVAVSPVVVRRLRRPLRG